MFHKATFLIKDIIIKILSSSDSKIEKFNRCNTLLMKILINLLGKLPNELLSFEETNVINNI